MACQEHKMDLNSADVELSLRIDQTVFPLHKISPTRAVLRHPVDLAAGPAELVVSVDGNDEVSKVRLRSAQA